MRTALLFASSLLLLNAFGSIPKEKLVAHMGGLEVSYANTLKAFESAFKAGIAAECDVRKSPDGTLYLSHDARKDWQNATRLEDVLKIMKEGDVLELDIKEKGIGNRKEEVGNRKEEVGNREEGISAELETLLSKSRGTFMLPDGRIITPNTQTPKRPNLQTSKPFPTKWLSVKWDDKKLTKEYFAAMASSNIAVKVWTIDDEATAKKVLERGAKWVTTNIPLAMSGLVEKGTHPDYAGDPKFVDHFRTAALDIGERRCAGINRLSTGGGFSGFFVWDSVFGVLWAIHAPERKLPIVETLDIFYKIQDEDGFICREYTKDAKPCWDKSHPWAYNPPILAWGEIEMFRAKLTDKARLEKVYPHLVKFHRCYDRNLKRTDGLYFGDMLGGGMDDIPRWPYGWEKDRKAKIAAGECDGIRATRETIGEAVRDRFWRTARYNAWKHCWNRQAGWIDMSAQMAFDCLNLAEIADAIGRHDEAATWRAEHKRIADLVNKFCWDEKRGFYFDYTESGFVSRYTVAAFWTLLAKIPSAAQAAKMVKVFDDPQLFGTPVPVTAMAPESKDYRANGYWRGQSWPPVTYVTLRGLREYGYGDLAARLARAWYNANALAFDRDHTVYEHLASSEAGLLNSVTHRDFCGWGALTPIAIAEEFGFYREMKSEE